MEGIFEETVNNLKIGNLQQINESLLNLSEDNALKQYVYFKKMEKYAQEAMLRLKDAAIKEASVNLKGKKDFPYHDTIVTVRKAVTRYKYDVSAEWREAKHVCEEADLARKTIEDKLKIATEEFPYVSKSTGEVIIECPKEPSEDTIVIKLL